MREILFRGKREDNGEWFYGDYNRSYVYNSIAYITGFFPDSMLRVDSNTVGQWTGLVDKNGKKVFEGDVVKYIPRENCEIIYEVIWQQEYSRFALVQWSRSEYKLYEWAEPEKVRYMCEVIGNIHDNPELLEVVK